MADLPSLCCKRPASTVLFGYSLSLQRIGGPNLGNPLFPPPNNSNPPPVTLNQRRNRGQFRPQKAFSVSGFLSFSFVFFRVSSGFVAFRHSRLTSLQPPSPSRYYPNQSTGAYVLEQGLYALARKGNMSSPSECRSLVHRQSPQNGTVNSASGKTAHK